MRDHTKLRAFVLADEVAMRTYRETLDFPKEEVYGLTAQMRRAAVSVPSNIVEGCARESQGEYLRTLKSPLPRSGNCTTRWICHAGWAISAGPKQTTTKRCWPRPRRCWARWSAPSARRTGPRPGRTRDEQRDLSGMASPKNETDSKKTASNLNHRMKSSTDLSEFVFFIRLLFWCKPPSLREAAWCAQRALLNPTA